MAQRPRVTLESNVINTINRNTKSGKIMFKRAFAAVLLVASLGSHSVSASPDPRDLPEPATAAMLALGLCLLASAHRRQS
jgi:hypothetical protein